MKSVIRCLAFASIITLSVLAIHPTASHAQSGSAGGTIGNDDKSVSGSHHGRSTERSHSDDRPRRPSRRSGGGGTGNFDGAWMVYAVGTTCQGSSSNPVVVTSGKIIGGNARGTVSPNGTVHGSASNNGITIITTGRLSGRRGGGTFRQSDGCTGRWTAVKQ